MQSELGGIPFIGENGRYPHWARGSGRWVFQRTLVMIGQVLGDIARLHAMEVPVSDQIIVWCPPRRLPFLGSLPSAVHRERQRAVAELQRFTLVCYGDRCGAPKPGVGATGMALSSVIRESGVQPDDWLLACPFCSASVGPDLGCLSRDMLVTRWEAVGRPKLENPGAGAGIGSAAAISELPQWIAQLDPSHMELAYLGQQMWPDIRAMLEAMPPFPSLEIK
jgi:hypothetical protein